MSQRLQKKSKASQNGLKRPSQTFRMLGSWNPKSLFWIGNNFPSTQCVTTFWQCSKGSCFFHDDFTSLICFLNPPIFKNPTCIAINYNQNMLQKCLFNICLWVTACPCCHRQYCIFFKQGQRKAYKPTLHWGRVHPELASSSVIIDKWRPRCLSKAIAPFSDPAHIWLSLRKYAIFNWV